MIKRALIVLVATTALVACGSDDPASEDTAAPTSAAATTVAAPTAPAPTTAAATTTSAAATTTTAVAATTTSAAGGIVPGADPEVDAVVTAYSAVFDSSVDFPTKAKFIEDADALRATVEAYGAAGSSMNGIELSPTAVDIDGDTAVVTYDVLFGGTAAYEGLTGGVTKVDDTWMVSRVEFCAFMAQARTPCPA